MPENHDFEIFVLIGLAICIVLFVMVYLQGCTSISVQVAREDASIERRAGIDAELDASIEKEPIPNRRK